MSRRIVMVARRVMYDIRQSRATRQPSDWRGASEISAGRTGGWDLVAGELCRRFQSVFVMLRDIENIL